MKGYILFDEQGRKLTRYLAWSKMAEAGWLWSLDEVDALLLIAKYWNKRPVWSQHCELVREKDGDVNVYALEEPVEL